MASNTLDKKKLASIVKSLSAGDEDVTLKVLKEIRENGNEKLIPILVELLADSDSEKVKAEVISVLHDLKDSPSIPALIEAMKTPKGQQNLAILISVFWQSKLQPIDYIDVLVEYAIKGDYMVCLEVLTVIENLEGPFEEEPLMESMVKLNSYFSEPTNNEKDELLRTIEQLIKKIDNSL